MNPTRALLLFLLLSMFLTALCQGQVTFTGYGAGGFKYFNRDILRDYNQQMYYEGKLQADLTISKHIEAQLDFRGNSEDRNVILREFSVKFEYDNFPRVKFGNIKKPFGIEQMTDREEFVTVDDSYIHRQLDQMGYATRDMSLMIYQNYSSKHPERPYAYHLAFFKNNSLVNGAVGRGSYIMGEWTVSADVLIQNRGGDQSISTFALGGDVQYETGPFQTSLEAFYAQDPDEGIRRRLAGRGEKVFVLGAKSMNAMQFDTGGDVIKEIEPMLLLCWYTPDAGDIISQTFEVNTGANFYFHKHARLRLNGDILMTKTRGSDEVSLYDSRVTLELQVSF